MFLIIGPTILDMLIAKSDSLPVVCGDEFTQSSFLFCDKPINKTMGGNGGNSACALARLGANVTLCSSIGKDHYGDILYRFLAESGVNGEGVVRKDNVSTSTTSIVSDKKLNRIAFHYSGTSSCFSNFDINMDLCDKSTIALISGYTLLPQLRLEGIEQVVKRLKEKNTTIALDIGPAVNNPITLEEIGPFVEHIDYLLCNEYELKHFTGSLSLEDGMILVKRSGVDTVIVKCGDKGARFLENTQGRTEIIEGFRVDPFLTVGAGDAFNAGFLYCIGDGRNLQESVRFANAVAAHVISSREGVLTTPSAKEIESFLSSPGKLGV